MENKTKFFTLFPSGPYTKNSIIDSAQEQGETCFSQLNQHISNQRMSFMVTYVDIFYINIGVTMQSTYVGPRSLSKCGLS